MHKTILILISLFIPALFVLTGSASVEPAPTLQPTEDASVDSCEMLYEKLHLDSVVSRRAFRQAVEGYKKIEQRRKDILTLIDFSKPSTEQRLFVIDMKAEQVLFATVVSHGKNSGGNYATSFSNEEGSLKSSLGFYLTGETYKGRNGYSLILDGLEKGINDRARQRAIVMHGAAYSNPSVIRANGRLGRSFGCPAVPQALSRPIIDAIKEQAEKLCFVGPSYACESRSKLAEMGVDLMPDNIAKVFFTNGGADANENAIKMARMYTGRKKVFSRYRSYHGSTFGAGNLTGEPRRYPLEPGIPGFVKFFDPYMYRDNLPFASEKEYSEYYVNKLREQVVYEGPDTVAAIVMETITGSNGIIIPPEGYLAGVRRICDEFGIMMICDEVMAGFGRTGKMFAFENFGVKPDIVSFAKGVTCGYVQLGGVAVSRKIADYFDDNVLQCGLTYSGHPLACAAGVACLNYNKDNDILGNVNKSGKELGELLEELKAKHKCVGDVRYIGLFSAVELVKDKATREPLVPYGGDKLGVMGGIIGKLKAKKFMTYSHENMILVCPPLIITPEQLREEMVKLDEVLAEVDATL